jgi:hypothetical protein
MSRQAIELFRQYTERLKQEPQGPEHTAQKAQAPSEEPKKPNLVAEMSRIEHEVRQIFDNASLAERDKHYSLPRNTHPEPQAGAASRE